MYKVSHISQKHLVYLHHIAIDTVKTNLHRCYKAVGENSEHICGYIALKS